MIILILVLLGLSLGSFVNALVFRIHEQAKTSSGSKKKRQLSITKGRSICPHCLHQLSAKDLIPVFSWLSLRGKCRYCNQKIDDSPLTEIVLPVLFLISYVYWPMAFNAEGTLVFAVWLVMLTGFLALAIYDLKWFLLPDRIVFPLIGLAAGQLIVQALVFHHNFNPLLSGFYGAMVGGGLFYVLFQISKGKWIGGGDVKLGALLGLIVGGPSAGLLLLFLSSALGTLVALPMMATGKATKSSRLPFGPYLIVAAIIVRLFGGAIVTWYQQRFLHIV